MYDVSSTAAALLHFESVAPPPSANDLTAARYVCRQAELRTHQRAPFAGFAAMKEACDQG